jgi:hypothetical protein
MSATLVNLFERGIISQEIVDDTLDNYTPIIVTPKSVLKRLASLLFNDTVSSHGYSTVLIKVVNVNSRKN